ncbi:MAG: ACT domain-containing protein [Ruminococcus sp.]|nr:ACT domain-containing protein [Ruminococcus sp.]
MSVKQISVFVENRPGRLSAVTGHLGNAGVNIRAITTADTKDFGILRLIVDDTDKAVEVLKKNDCVVTITNVLAVIAEDTPGGMAKMMDVLYNENISVEYMYSAFLNPSDATACLIIRVDNGEGAVMALKEAGYKMVSKEELFKF